LSVKNWGSVGIGDTMPVMIPSYLSSPPFGSRWGRSGFGVSGKSTSGGLGGIPFLSCLKKPCGTRVSARKRRGTSLGRSFYTRDHLGSIRELTDNSQIVRARYDYDPYGNVTKISGDKDSSFLYTGHFWHQQSGLYLTPFRAYDPELGRWLSRDPSGEYDSTNLYEYVGNSPVGFMDPSGLSAWDVVNEPWFQGLADTGTSIGGFWKDVFTGNVQKNAAMRYAQGPLGQAEALTNPCSDSWLDRNAFRLTAGATTVAAVAAVAAAGFIGAEIAGITDLGSAELGWQGGELTFTRVGTGSKDLRINPLGDWGNKNPLSQRPHWHYRPGPGIPGQGIGRHLPWDWFK